MTLEPLWLVGAGIVGGLLARLARGPAAAERARLLRDIAHDAAALALSMNPTASWASLLQNVINQVATASGTPTRNQAAIQRAAAAALTELGVKPGR
jgi:hypothetical protein